ncbi:MAG TPA: hypothetical protein VK620_18040 [Bradyrhizobium sp.]|nr:hypothetical protein [Bradyrhizobium sp.]
MRLPSTEVVQTADHGAFRPSLPWLLGALLLAGVLAVPFVLVDVPPVLDYPNHLARYFVLSHPGDPVLSLMYAPHWRLLPNLGMDVLGAGLLKVTPVHVGGRLLLALSLFAPVIGVIVYHVVAFNRFSYWPLASGVVAYNGVFHLGFMNFLLSVGLAFAGAAAWIALRRRGGRSIAAVVAAVAAAVIFLCHIFGLLLFALLICAEEAARLLNAKRSGDLGVAEVVRTGAMLTFALSPAVILYIASPLGGGAASIGAWRGFQKLWTVFTPFMTTSVNLTLITGIAVFSVAVICWRNAVFAPATTPALVTLALLFLIAPSTLKGGTFVDVRLALMLGLFMFAGVQPRLTSAHARMAGLIFVILIAVRAGYISATWIEHRQDLADLRAAMAPVKPAARVLVARGHPGHITEAALPERALPGIYRLDGHLAALLVVERRAFWPLMFADPTQQPLEVRAHYAGISQPTAEPVEWSVLSQDHFSDDTLGNARYLTNWRANFDQVLLIDPSPPVSLPRGLKPAVTTPFAILYDIEPAS